MKAGVNAKDFMDIELWNITEIIKLENTESCGFGVCETGRGVSGKIYFLSSVLFEASYKTWGRKKTYFVLLFFFVGEYFEKEKNVWGIP